MSEYNSREIPSGFRVVGAVFLGCDGPATELGSGRDRALRISDAEAAMVVESKKNWHHV